MVEAKATAKYVRGSPQKARLVIDLIRGKRAAEALAILQNTNKRVCGPLEKVLRSAIANAQQKAVEEAKRIDEDDLVVTAAYANQGPSLKRIRPAPMGRAYRVVHRTTHLTVEVSEREED
ncbi:MAG: 50S ribosomal protein L22 [Vicinamibacteria bacterium]